MRIRKRSVLSLAVNISVAIPVFYFSTYYSTLYWSGDQEWYTNFYNSLIGAPISRINFLQLANTGSAEPLYGWFTWLGAQVSDKITWFSIFNVLLVFSLHLFLKTSKY